MRVLPILLAFAVPLIGQQPPRTLAEMRDRYRPLLIFAPPHEIQTEAVLQIAALEAHRSELLDRQIMIIPPFNGYCGILDPQTVTLMPGELPTIRHRFHIHTNDFTVILLGKDGGEKFRSHTPVTIEQLNRIIDAMPMRQEEMRERPR